MTARLRVRTIGLRSDESRPEVWVPEFACPECGEPVRPDGPRGFVCRACVFRFEQSNGIYRFLRPHHAEAVAPFLHQYRLVRGREGYGSSSPEYYRGLPVVPPTHPRADEWRVRRESYARLRYSALRPIMRSPLRILDLGAGCGWLSHRLTCLGHDVVAVDQLDDEMDGLGACRHYDVRFPVVQADFSALPFAPAQFDLVVFNGSLHYSPDPATTLLRATRMLTPGGVLAVMDSPMFARERDGQAMLDRTARQMELEYGLSSVLRPGVGFLTFAGLAQAATLLGVSSRFYRSRGPFTWRLRRQLGRLRLCRAPAAFGVWVAA